jgi:hypothetical protein
MTNGTCGGRAAEKDALPRFYAGVATGHAGFSGTTGKHAFDQRLFGTANEPRLQGRALYLAAKGTVAVSERVRAVLQGIELALI